MRNRRRFQRGDDGICWLGDGCICRVSEGREARNYAAYTKTSLKLGRAGDEEAYVWKRHVTIKD